MHEKLSHLTPDQLSELLEHYYDPERNLTVAAILERFAIDARPGELASLLPPQVHDRDCPYCPGESLITPARSRTSAFVPVPRCPRCDHQERTRCPCDGCQALRQSERDEEERVHRGLVLDTYGDHQLPDPVTIDCLSLKSCLYLQCLISHKSSEDLTVVEPFFNGQQPLTPSTELTSEVVRHVYGQTYWTAPSPHSPLSAFAFDEEEQEPPGFYLRGVEWRLLPQLDELERREWLRALDNRLEQLRYADGVEDLERALWRSIVKHEAIEYYALKRAEVGYELDVIGERTNRVFDLLSERLSLAQIYHVIFVSVRNTHHHITKERIPKYRGKNFFLGAIERNADRYAAEGWLKEYRRDFNCPQSTLSSVFFDGYLQIGGSYFTQVAPAVSGDLS